MPNLPNHFYLIISRIQAINALIANPTASFLAFDIVRHSYTAAAINGLREMFPGRNINLLTGDSATAVPSFARVFSPTPDSGVKCNVIFIDGSHDYDFAITDIVNFAALANRTFHRVIMDDGELPDVQRAWAEAKFGLGIMREVDIITVEETLCANTGEIIVGPLAGSMLFMPCPNMTDLRTPRMDDLYVGEYIF